MNGEAFPYDLHELRGGKGVGKEKVLVGKWGRGVVVRGRNATYSPHPLFLFSRTKKFSAVRNGGTMKNVPRRVEDKHVAAEAFEGLLVVL